MTYILDRDGIAACPDDFLRVGTPLCIDIDDDAIQALANEYEHKARLVLTGGLPYAIFDGKRYDKSALYEVITDDVEWDVLASLLVGSVSTANTLIEKWARKAAENELLGE